MQNGRGFERLVNFSDAVVAIALTLLVLPLVDIPAGLVADVGLGGLWQDHRQQFFSFLISFLVIWTLWRGHNRTMEHFRAYDRVVMALHLLWLLTIVLLPFATELLSSPFVDQRASAPVYLTNLLISTGAMLALELRGRAVPVLLRDDEDAQSWHAGRVSWSSQAVILLSLVLTFVQPSVGLWSLLLLTVDGSVDRLRRRRRAAS